MGPQRPFARPGCFSPSHLFRVGYVSGTKGPSRGPCGDLLHRGCDCTGVQQYIPSNWGSNLDWSRVCYRAIGIFRAK